MMEDTYVEGKTGPDGDTRQGSVTLKFEAIDLISIRNRRESDSNDTSDRLVQ
jgi:hypothetical protein